jgi:undecaprenyl-diphosphatase
MNPTELADRAASSATAATDARWLRAIQPAVETGNAIPLWGTCAAALALLGWRARRAAIEACLASAAASGASTGIIKNLNDRKRPCLRPGTKTSPSMPSSHAATASAFATAATTRLPAVGIVLVPLAGAVSLSRVHERHHFLGDAIAGTVLGAATGVLIHHLSNRLVPTDPQERIGAPPTNRES